MATNTNARGTAAPGNRRAQKARDHLEEAMDSEKPVFPYPKNLPEKHREIWRDTVNTKTGDYWSKGDIPILMMYCRCAHDIDRLTNDIEDEGEVIDNARGNPVVNPKVVVRGFAEARLMGLCTKLRLQPSSRMDTKNEANQGNKKAKANRAAATVQNDEDGLLGGHRLMNDDSPHDGPLQ